MWKIFGHCKYRISLCDQAVIPPFLRGKMIELDKFFFVSKMFELNLSYFRESGTVEVNFQHRILKFREENTRWKKIIFSASINTTEIFLNMVGIFARITMRQFVKFLKLIFCTSQHFLKQLLGFYNFKKQNITETFTFHFSEFGRPPVSSHRGDVQ